MAFGRLNSIPRSGSGSARHIHDRHDELIPLTVNEIRHIFVQLIVNHAP